MSIECRLGTAQVRRSFGIELPKEDANLAWAIVDEERRLIEWQVGIVQNNRSLMAQTYKGRVEDWAEDQWRCSDNPSMASLVLSDKVYTDYGGRCVLTEMSVNGIHLKRVFALTVGDASAFLFLCEAERLGFFDTCMEAIVRDQARMAEKFAKDSSPDGVLFAS